jgi:hypothetical protein
MPGYSSVFDFLDCRYTLSHGITGLPSTKRRITTSGSLA